MDEDHTPTLTHTLTLTLTLTLTFTFARETRMQCSDRCERLGALVLCIQLTSKAMSTALLKRWEQSNPGEYSS